MPESHFARVPGLCYGLLFMMDAGSLNQAVSFTSFRR